MGKADAGTMIPHILSRLVNVFMSDDTLHVEYESFKQTFNYQMFENWLSSAIVDTLVKLELLRDELRTRVAQLRFSLRRANNFHPIF